MARKTAPKIKTGISIPVRLHRKARRLRKPKGEPFNFSAYVCGLITADLEGAK